VCNTRHNKDGHGCVRVFSVLHCVAALRGGHGVSVLQSVVVYCSVDQMA